MTVRTFHHHAHSNGIHKLYTTNILYTLPHPPLQHSTTRPTHSIIIMRNLRIHPCRRPLLIRLLQLRLPHQRLMILDQTIIRKLRNPPQMQYRLLPTNLHSPRQMADCIRRKIPMRMAPVDMFQWLLASLRNKRRLKGEVQYFDVIFLAVALFGCDPAVAVRVEGEAGHAFVVFPEDDAHALLGEDRAELGFSAATVRCCNVEIFVHVGNVVGYGDDVAFVEGPALVWRFEADIVDEPLVALAVRHGVVGRPSCWSVCRSHGKCGELGLWW